MGHRAAVALTIAMGAGWTLPAAAAVIELVPSATVGVTNNASSAPSDLAANVTEGFVIAGGSARLSLNRPTSTHRLAYGVYTTQYQTTTAADNTAQSLAWRSDLHLSGRTELGLGADLALFRYSAILGVSPATGNATAAPVGTTPTYVFSPSVSETLSYQPTGREHYLQSFTTFYTRPLDTLAPIREVVDVAVGGRAERLYGLNTASLTLAANDLIPLDNGTAVAGPFSNGDTITAELLAGWRRELSPRTAVEAQAGPLAFYNTAAHSLAMGPAVILSASYRAVPWFATLAASQQPTVNIYQGEAFMADSVIARVTLPLTVRENFIVAGIAGYTYARRITGDQHFVFAPRAYDLLLLRGTVAYHFLRLPLYVGLDYSITDQRGSVASPPFTSVPNMRRRIIGLSIGGTFSFGEGSMWVPGGE